MLRASNPPEARRQRPDRCLPGRARRGRGWPPSHTRAPVPGNAYGVTGRHLDARARDGRRPVADPEVDGRRNSPLLAGGVPDP